MVQGSGLSRPLFFLDPRVTVGGPSLHAMGRGPASSMHLTVRFESQHDNATGTGWRECFSSSAAMLAGFWGASPNDDAYNRARIRFGDTTGASAQVAALRSLGLKSHFWTNGTRRDLENEILGGRPVAVGWLHQGPLSFPRGGHWSVICGLSGSHFLMHDPAGEPMLVSGGHMRASSGRSCRCSWTNFLPRWEVEGPRSGWYLTCSR